MYYKRQPQNQLNTKIISSNLSSIPWEEAARLYQEAADLAEQNQILALESIYQTNYNRQRETALRLANISETEAAYEGDLGIELKPAHIPQPELRELRYKAGTDALKEYFIKPYQIQSWGIKLLDQILADYSQHKLNNLGSEGTISGLQYLQDNLDPQNDRDMGIYRFLMLDSRSEYLPKMGTGEAKKYCTLVPLILYAHKLYNNIDYSRWERESLQYVVNPALNEAMLTEIPELTRQRTLELRDIGLVQKGEKRNPVSTYSLYRLQDTEIGHCNGLAKIMVCQTWAAHPSNRTKYMVLDPMNWDAMPSPLVEVDIFKTSAVKEFVKPTKTPSTTDVWM
jgi:hypothetical protein